MDIVSTCRTLTNRLFDYKDRQMSCVKLGLHTMPNLLDFHSVAPLVLLSLFSTNQMSEKVNIMYGHEKYQNQLNFPNNIFADHGFSSSPSSNTLLLLKTVTSASNNSHAKLQSNT